MFTEKQAQAIADALLSCNAAREFDIKSGLVRALQHSDFSEWRLNYGKLYVNCGRMWYGGGASWKEGRIVQRTANRLLAEVVAHEGLNLRVPSAYYRATKPLTIEAAEAIWQATNLSTPLDDARKDKFIAKLTNLTDEDIYVPTRNRNEGLYFLNDSFGFHLSTRSGDWRRRSYHSAEEALRKVFAAHCAAHNL